MADVKSAAQIDKEALEKFTRLYVDSRQREARLFRHYEWRGNKLPPFNIEPMPFERQRLAGAGMTPADRLARKQWVLDQELSPNEPRHIKELRPRNIFRRMYGAPWDAFFKIVGPLLGKERTAYGRYVIPRACMAVGAVWFAWYNLKYHPNTWENKVGWHTFWGRSKKLPVGDEWPDMEYKQKGDFFDKGFKTRKVLLD